MTKSKNPVSEGSTKTDDSTPLNLENSSHGISWHNTKFKLYAGYFLSRWGDRMWMFALSIVLGSIGNHNLQLPAVNGFMNSIAVLLFAASVGRWIDKTPRLKAATTVLIANNFAVALSAGLLVVILLAPHVQYLERFDFSPGHATIITKCLVSGSIFLCAVSTLASCGTKICISKDWVVVMSDGNMELLADINAWMVRLDLTSMILSPLIAGQIMTSFGQAAGCLYIALWNLLSFIVEYFVLRSIYYSCPALAQKAVKLKSENADKLEAIDCQQCHLPVCSCVYNEDLNNLIKSSPSDKKTLSTSRADNRSRRRRLSSVHEITKPLRKALGGWILYYRQQPMFYAGVGLALLYLTVLGLDGITTVYIYSQGLRENVVALSRGAGAIVGILGSVAYPCIRKRSGLIRTGIYALISQILCNFLAVISIFLPGSPFDPVAYFSDDFNATNDGFETSVPKSFHFGNGSTSNVTTENSKISILTFLTGIVLARFGLWMADLAITQIMQEQIVDNERGVINGVQHSLNQLLNMIKDILVILLPDPRTFGILIIISCFSVCSGFLCYLIFAGKSPGNEAKRSRERHMNRKEEKTLFMEEQTNNVGTDSEV